MRITNLTPFEAAAAGLDIVEINTFPISVASLGHCKISFEESDAALWVLGIETEDAHRNRGEATRMIEAFTAHFAHKTINWGIFTDDGERWVKPCLVRHGARLTSYAWATVAVSQRGS